MNHSFAFERRLASLERRVIALGDEARRIKDRLLPLRGTAFEAAAIAAGDGFNTPISDGGANQYTITDAHGVWPIVTGPAWVFQSGTTVHCSFNTISNSLLLGCAQGSATGTVFEHGGASGADTDWLGATAPGFPYYDASSSTVIAEFNWLYMLIQSLDGFGVPEDVINIYTILFRGVTSPGGVLYPIKKVYTASGALGTSPAPVGSLSTAYSMATLQSAGSETETHSDVTFTDPALVNQGLSADVTLTLI